MKLLPLIVGELYEDEEAELLLEVLNWAATGASGFRHGLAGLPLAFFIL